ncbi:hypothetical protein OUZ56_029473 [Daphnia magna]|uniref:Uncharacterized protein n=1 Tax=Daphnia magna TaxID=35525 RepID=A0ABR0B6Y7_9CRUS|nr:hypothetical protein OUZ56_029473 [Daphnia magna]
MFEGPYRVLVNFLSETADSGLTPKCQRLAPESQRIDVLFIFLDLTPYRVSVYEDSGRLMAGRRLTDVDQDNGKAAKAAMQQSQQQQRSGNSRQTTTTRKKCNQNNNTNKGDQPGNSVEKRILSRKARLLLAQKASRVLRAVELFQTTTAFAFIGLALVSPVTAVRLVGLEHVQSLLSLIRLNSVNGPRVLLVAVEEKSRDGCFGRGLARQCRRLASWRRRRQESFGPFWNRTGYWSEMSDLYTTIR